MQVFVVRERRRFKDDLLEQLDELSGGGGSAEMKALTVTETSSGSHSGKAFAMIY